MAKTKFKKGETHKVVPEIVNETAQKSNNKFYLIIIFLFAFLIYGNTITNDYALDDAIVITQNDFTKKGVYGISEILTTELFTGFFGVQKNLVMGGRYRPLSVVTFAVEYEFFGQNPHVSHFINILLFALSCIVLFLVLKKILQNYDSEKWYLSLPFISTLLFAAHPLHTEVVANIKGRDEIFTLLGSLLALYYTIKYLDLNKIKYLLFSFVAFFLALTSKENAITFVLIIPLTVYYFTKHSFKRNFISVFPLVASTVVYLVIRQVVIGSTSTDIPSELMNDSFLGASVSDKYATITYTLGYYIRLLFVPHPLTFDYYPYMIPIISWSDPRAFISLIIHLVLIYFAFKGMKNKTLFSYSIWFYAITFSLTTNILFPIGTFMSERFMYTPSIAFVIIIAFLIMYKVPVWFKKSESKNIIMALTGIFLVLFSIKTISRNMDWKNDFTLFTTDVIASTNSAKSNCSAGGKLIEEATKKGNENLKDQYLKQAIEYLNKSVKIHPTYADALLLLGNAHFEYNRDFEEVWKAYRKILIQNPDYEKVHSNLQIMFNKVDTPDVKIRLYEEVYKLASHRYDVNYELGTTYGKKKNILDKALFYLENAYKIDPNKPEIYKDLGVGYGLSQNYPKALEFLEKAVKIDPKDFQMHINLGVTYQIMGEKEKAEQAFAKANELNPNLKKKAEEAKKDSVNIVK